MKTAGFVREHKLGRRFEKNLGTGKNEQRHPPTLMTILMKESNDRCENCEKITNAMKHSKIPFQLVKSESHKMIKSHRSKGQKVSKDFININAKNQLHIFVQATRKHVVFVNTRILKHGKKKGGK